MIFSISCDNYSIDVTNDFQNLDSDFPEGFNVITDEDELSFIIKSDSIEECQQIFNNLMKKFNLLDHEKELTDFKTACTDEEYQLCYNEEVDNVNEILRSTDNIFYNA